MGYIYPDCDLRRWEYCNNSVILANADDYYTKKEVEDLIDDVSGMSPSEVQNMINDSIRTKADKSEVNELAIQVSGKAENSAVTEVNNTITAHTANTSIHVTVADKTAWNAKLDAADVENFFGAVNYDSNSKRINFYNTSTGGTVLAYIDATDFIKDGMVSNVEIKEVAGKGTCLVITFNSDAGKQAIEIPISEIFDASNFYTKTEVDAELSGKTDNSTFTAYTSATDTVISGKASQSDLDTLSGTVTAHTANTDIHVTTSDKTTWNGKQDALVNQVNIKSINGNSILGSGDLMVDTGLHAEVSETTLIFS